MNRSEHLLTVFAEELGELAVELLLLQKHILKAQRFGLDGVGEMPVSNRQRIENEWQDLLGSIKKLQDVGVCLLPDINMINKKMERIDEYCGKAVIIGTLIDDITSQ